MRDDRTVSRRLSYVLRHAPGSIGVRLDPGGWVDVDELLAGLAASGLRLTRAQLDDVVARNDKRRFAHDASGRRIRASQGHTVPVDLGLPAVVPPAELFHGTPLTALPAVLEQGLRPGRRHAVHLSPDVVHARTVGRRRGPAAVLAVAAASLSCAGTEFTVSDNGVWLVPSVPPAYLHVLERDR